MLMRRPVVLAILDRLHRYVISLQAKQRREIEDMLEPCMRPFTHTTLAIS